MSNEITRFNHVTDWGMERDSDGDYVLHSEHEAEVARLRAELDGIKEQYEAASEHLAELRAEVEKLHAKLDRKEGQRKLAESECASMRKDAERYRWIRSPYAARAGSLVGLHSDGELDYQIDKAMGDPA